MEKENEALALATALFAAGFFLGVGTGILLSPYPGSRTRQRLKSAAEELVGEATKSLEDMLGKGKDLLH
jgi:hypothetical protein